MNDDNILETDFGAQSKTSIRYFAYASIAEKEGYRQVARLFKALAEAEKVQAINTLKIIGELDDSSNNLSWSIDNKTHDYTQRYPTFIEQADREGNPGASTSFRNVIKTSKAKIRLLNEALNNLGRNKDFDYWVCGACGFIDTGEMPVSCKNCSASRENFTRSELENVSL